MPGPTTGYEWVHGPTDRHLTHFDSTARISDWTDDVLQSDGGWPYVPFYYPAIMTAVYATRCPYGRRAILGQSRNPRDF